MDITVISSVLFGPFSLSHYKTTVKGQISFFERREVGKGGLLGNFQKKRSCTAKLPATAETKRVQKSSKFFYSPGPEFAPKKKPLIHNLKVPKKIRPQKSAHLTSSPPSPLPPATLSEK